VLGCVLTMSGLQSVAKTGVAGRRRRVFVSTERI